MEDLRDPQTLAAGVPVAIDCGVMLGVGSGPKRANVGIGGSTLGLGSRYRGNTVAGVGVVSCDVESIGRSVSVLWIDAGVGVVGDARSKPEKPSFSGNTFLSAMGSVSRSAVSRGIMRFHMEQPEVVFQPGEGGAFGE